MYRNIKLTSLDGIEEKTQDELDLLNNKVYNYLNKLGFKTRKERDGALIYYKDNLIFHLITKIDTLPSRHKKQYSCGCVSFGKFNQAIRPTEQDVVLCYISDCIEKHEIKNKEKRVLPNYYETLNDYIESLTCKQSLQLENIIKMAHKEDVKFNTLELASKKFIPEPENRNFTIFEFMDFVS